MSTKRFYQCNLCGYAIQKHGFHRRGCGFGIRFAASEGGDEIQIKALRDAETHMCGECLDALLEALSKIPEAQREPEACEADREEWA